MELDNLKKAWQNVEPANTLTTEQIESMLRCSNNGALQRLFSWEKLSMQLLTICIVMFSVLLILRYFLLSTSENSTTISYIYLAYMGFCVIAAVWQGYKIGCLKKIDVTNMSMTTLSKAITRYRTYIIYEIAVGIVFIFTFILALFYFTLGTNEPIYVYVIFGIFFLGLVFGALLLCKHVYGYTIKRLQQNLKEAKEFGIE